VEYSQHFRYNPTYRLMDKLLYFDRHRLTADALSTDIWDPSELLVRVRPKQSMEDDATGLESLAEWFARWLALCLPGEEQLQDEVLRRISIWART
jgi:hypothetical protein